ncbi:hypothetical protein [Bacillus solimangrovi]|uniref:Uncharacterized protein n=1 Tax=Bacillus solimangrovi TaxID=1305675 RepID=A0A1E5LJT5_9BACI|nr:hypothetical protein [Bacillus solimangrovi]OEH94296.1 hypothetical protein BFG57_08550 [Bacillus solimangrovi]
MKRLIWLSIPVFLLCLYFYPFLSWYFMNEKPLSISVIDKTVPRNDYREHRGFFWVLNHMKVRKHTEEKYEIDKDYYGYDPETYKGDEVFEIPDDVDLIYVADTYGVYEEDLRENIFGERSKLLYGELTIYEWNRVMANKTKENTLIVEFNTFASPTRPEVRKIVEQNLGITWTGWMGRYFPELDDSEVPVWLKENWEAQTGDVWDLKGEGIAFVNEIDRVIVIESDDLFDEVRFLWKEIGLTKYPYVSNSKYRYWFDIIMPSEDMIVEATYELQLSEQAKNLLKKEGIPLTIPAILHNPNEKMYYFSGDYSDVNTDYYSDWSMPGWYYQVNALFNPDDAFFWKVYVPLMKSIIQEQLM